MDSLMRADIIFLGVLGLGFGAALIRAVARALPHPERRPGRAGADADSGPDWSWNWGSHSDAAGDGGGGDGAGGGDGD